MNEIPGAFLLSFIRVSDAGKIITTSRVDINHLILCDYSLVKQSAASKQLFLAVHLDQVQKVRDLLKNATAKKLNQRDVVRSDVCCRVLKVVAYFIFSLLCSSEKQCSCGHRFAVMRK